MAVLIVALGVAMTSTPRASATPLRLGDRSGYVASWQAAVNIAMQAATAVEKRPYTPLVVDGVFGPLTERATRRFQGMFKAPVTGVVGAATWKRWYESSLTPSCMWPRELLAEGDRSGCTGWWQIVLNRWLASSHQGTAPLVLDGVFGPLTEAATLAFQRAHGLVVDGIVGRHTWAAALNANLTHLP